MEEQKEEKYIHFENVSKNIYTTIFGFALMSLSLTALIIKWFFNVPKIDTVPYWQLAVVAAVGFILLFMRDNVKSYLDIFIKKKIDKE
jgi:hypothetical protein